MKRSAQLFKALSDETRLRLLALLKNGELCVCDLMTVLDLPQSTVSRHLAYLRNVGLVEDRRQGIWMYYRLPEGGGPLFADLQTLLQQHLSGLSQARADQRALESYLSQKVKGACG